MAHTEKMEELSQWLSDDQDDDIALSFLSKDDDEILSLSDYIQESFSEVLNANESSYPFSIETPSTNLILEQPPDSQNDQTKLTSFASIAQPSSNISFVDPKNGIDQTVKNIYCDGSEWIFETLSLEGSQKVAKRAARTSSCNQEHVITERNRREKLSQHFITLSGIIPGIKKTDKASLLSDAINYLKQLEMKVKLLEVQANEENNNEDPTSSTLTKNNSSNTITISASNSSGMSNPSLASIIKMEARLNVKTLLLRIQCERKKGALVKLISEIEKRHLSILSISAMPSEGPTLNITITSNVEDGFSMTMKDLVSDLNSAMSHNT